MLKKKLMKPEPQFDADYVVYRALGIVWGPCRMDDAFFQYSPRESVILAQGAKEAMEAARRLLGAYDDGTDRS